MKKSKIYIVMTIIAALIFAIAFLTRPVNIDVQTFIYNALINIGFIIITIVLVNILWSLFGGDPYENILLKFMDMFGLFIDANETGLKHFYGLRS